MVYATNYSLGVNLFFALIEKFAKMTEPFHDSYQFEIEEIHHTQKLDAPSGTAITLAEKLISQNKNYSQWELENNQEISKNTLPIRAVRIDGIPGTHQIIFKSEIDKIVLTHEAFNRKGFASGAVLAAEFLQNNQGFFNMQDVLKF
jgi:4-hydroxy-tetrahydrodipicolinate reductase